MNNACTKTLLLLKSISLNLPILREFGCAPDKLMVLVVAKGQIASAIQILAGFKHQRISELMSRREIKKELMAAEPGFTFFVPSDSRRSKDVLDLLAAFTKDLGGAKDVISLPLIVTESMMLYGPDDEYFAIYLENEIAKRKIPLSAVVPPENQVEVIRDRVNEVVTGEKTQMEKALVAAAFCLYPMITNSGNEGTFPKYITLVDRLVEQEEDAKDTQDLITLFRKQLISWQRQTGFNHAYDREKISLEVEKHLDDVILYDPESVYIPEKLFREVCEQLTVQFPINTVKATLRDKKILECNAERTYVCKVLYYNSAGVANRKRMLKFNRSMLTEAGETDIVEQCLSSKGDDYAIETR